MQNTLSAKPQVTVNTQTRFALKEKKVPTSPIEKHLQSMSHYATALTDHTPKIVLPILWRHAFKPSPKYDLIPNTKYRLQTKLSWDSPIEELLSLLQLFYNPKYKSTVDVQRAIITPCLSYNIFTECAQRHGLMDRDKVINFYYNADGRTPQMKNSLLQKGHFLFNQSLYANIKTPAQKQKLFIKCFEQFFQKKLSEKHKADIISCIENGP